MELVKVVKSVSYLPMIEKDSYIPISEIIASVIRNKNSFMGGNPPKNLLEGFIYYDVLNPPNFWGWQESDDFHSLLELDIEYDNSYKYAEINPGKIKFLIEGNSMWNKRLTTFVMLGKNIKFIHNQTVERILEQFDFKEVNTPIGDKCYVNVKTVKEIQMEEYYSISPNAVKFYLEENNIESKNDIFHLVFEDSTILTVLGDSIKDVQNKLWGE